MSEHAPVVVKPADHSAFKLPESLSALSLPLSAGGAIALAAGLILGWVAVGSKFGLSAYLTAFMYCLTIAMGSLFFVLIQHLCRAGWSVVVRRVAELMMVMVVPLGLLFLPIVVTLAFGEGMLYRWDSETYATETHLDAVVWANKTGYLTTWFFSLRAVIYFGIWCALALYFFRNSVRQDETGEKVVTDKMQYWSGPAVMLFSLSLSFAAFDWVMSLAPMWFSTMFGVYVFAGSILSAHCAIAAGTYLLQKKGALTDEVTPEHYHDLGKLIFGFIFFWTYISFSQYMLIWYGNIPEETEWFYIRQKGVWGGVAILLIFLHWMLPFLGTMSRHVRRRPNLVFFWSVYILVMHYFDLYWMIMPEAYSGVPGDDYATAGGVPGVLSSLLCVVGMAALMVGIILRVASQNKLVPVRDPRFRESLAFENI
ncbi:MAG: hypothetical protein HKN47_21255 [Pirellulaceae bacterium]|nr:hypothetical protein [Pirellulaceae bacterium]